MTLAYLLVIAAVLAVSYLIFITNQRTLQVRSDASLAPRIQPIDIEAFRNLIDPAEREYLRRRLPGPRIPRRAEETPASDGCLR